MSITLTIAAEPVPLSINADGVALISGTRVTLDTVVSVFKQGATVEDIVRRFPSLKLVDVYAVVTYYLRHQEEVETYLQEQEKLAEEVRKQVEQRFPSEGLRDRLLARRAQAQSNV